MEQFKYSCRDDASVWLGVHYCYLCVMLIPISIVVLFWLLFYYPIIRKMWMLWHRYFFGYGQVDEEEELLNTEEDAGDILVSNFTRILMTEVKLAFTYIIAALFLTYTLNIAPITEGFSAPMSIFILWHLNFIYRSGEHIYIYKSTCYTQFTIIIKLIIFVLIRYVELYPSSRLNNESIMLFYSHCNISVEHHRQNYFLQFFLNDNKTSML
jgi:hypothetical protein